MTFPPLWQYFAPLEEREGKLRGRREKRVWNPGGLYHCPHLLLCSENVRLKDDNFAENSPFIARDKRGL